MSQPHKPFIPASPVLAETTVKAIIPGALISVILARANPYLGLFAGMAVSACIPAVVVSMVVLKMFRKNKIHENNIIQTATSAGEALIGILLAVPIVTRERNIFDLQLSFPGFVGLTCLLGVCFGCTEHTTLVL